MTRNFDEIHDMNPKSWLSAYRKSSVSYLIKMGVFYLGFGIFLQQITNLTLGYLIPNYQTPSVPISIVMGLASAPLEEVTFFGVPFYLTGNPLIILLGGIIWSSLHLFNTQSFYTSNLAYGTLLFTIPHIFFSLRAWQSGKGLFAIVFHFSWNAIVLFLKCSGNANTCIIIGAGWYMILDIMSIVALVVLSVMMYRSQFYKTRRSQQN